MFKKELKNNFKSLMIWAVILSSFFVMIFVIYPTVIDKMDPKLMQSYIESLPKELIKMMNLDISDIMSAFGWFTSKGFSMLILIGGMYAAILGGNIFLKEENDGTINYLLSKPISRRKIVTNKIMVGLCNITLLMLFTYVINLIGFNIIGDYNFKVLSLLYITCLLATYAIFGLCLCISSFFRKNKVMNSIAIGFVFFSYILQMIGMLAESVSWIKYLSVFEIAPVAYIVENSAIQPLSIIVSALIIIGSLAVAFYQYDKKEFY